MTECRPKNECQKRARLPKHHPCTAPCLELTPRKPVTTVIGVRSESEADIFSCVCGILVLVAVRNSLLVKYDEVGEVARGNRLWGHNYKPSYTWNRIIGRGANKLFFCKIKAIIDLHVPAGVHIYLLAVSIPEVSTPVKSSAGRLIL